MSEVKWNYDMEAAPRGKLRMRVDGDGNERATRGVIQKYVLLSILDKGVAKVVNTYRTEGSKQYPDGYWAGCAPDQAYAWAELPAPAPVPAATEEDEW